MGAVSSSSMLSRRCGSEDDISSPAFSSGQTPAARRPHVHRVRGDKTDGNVYADQVVEDRRLRPLPCVSHVRRGCGDRPEEDEKGVACPEPVDPHTGDQDARQILGCASPHPRRVVGI